MIFFLSDIRGHHRWEPQLEETLINFKSDPRIIKNGLKIRVTENNIYLTEMSPKIPIFGVFDLIEILQTLRNKPNAKLEETRPMKVIAFLKSEVKRMIRQMTPNPDQTIVQGLMDFIKQEKVDTCIHSQSLFHVLFEN